MKNVVENRIVAYCESPNQFIVNVSINDIKMKITKLVNQQKHLTLF